MTDLPDNDHVAMGYYAGMACAAVLREAAPDIACHLTKEEMTALAGLFVAFDVVDAADVLIEQWIDAEIADGECEPNDYTLADHRLVDCRIPEGLG